MTDPQQPTGEQAEKCLCGEEIYFGKISGMWLHKDAATELDHPPLKTTAEQEAKR